MVARGWFAKFRQGTGASKCTIWPSCLTPPSTRTNLNRSWNSLRTWMWMLQQWHLFWSCPVLFDPVYTCVCFVLQLFYRFISESFQHNSNQLRSSLVCPNWVCCQQSQIEWIVVVWYFGVLDWTRQCHHKHKFNNGLLFHYSRWCQVCPERSSSAASTADFRDID